MEDHAIIDLYFARADNAIAETADKYGRYCHTIAYNITQDTLDSEECVNDTYLRAWNAMPPTRPNSLSAFLGRIVRNLSLDRVRRKQAEKRAAEHMEGIREELWDCLPAESDTAKVADDLVLADIINRFLASLPEVTRNIFLRRYWYFSSVKELAADYHMSESKIKMMMMRARESLRAELEKEGFTP